MTGAKPGDLGAAKLETKGPPIALPLGIAESLGAVPWVPMPHIHTALRSFVAILCLSAPTSAQCLIELDLGQYDEGSALAISADGSAVVGLVRNQFGTIHRDACVWRGAGNIKILPPLSPSDIRSIAYDVSRDGAVIVGVSTDAAGQQRPVAWMSSGAPVDLMNGASVTQVRGLSLIHI